MKKTSENEPSPSEADKTPKNPQRFSTTPQKRNQEQIPFLYMAMREPPADYKNLPDTKKSLYRVIKVK